MIRGAFSSDHITLDPSTLTRIPPPVVYHNRAYEALVLDGGRLLVFFEVNGKRVNPTPVVHVFGLDLSTAGVIPFPNLEYRLTGATYAADGLIWVINKYAPREADVTPLIDPLAERHGRGPTHSRFNHVERLVPLINRGTHLVLADRSPIQLVLDQEPRDWEGVAMLDQRGFLLVTDEHPTTLLGFVPMPPRQ